mmetsp:Transcript_6308/g.15710  ORF Transcript_6308/g.15710 Transcript_6308/m.15710 type:complete len:205 (+) Transcript_6308:306-920(+)
MLRPPVPFLFVKSPPWHMKPGMMRWKGEALKQSPISPVQSALKFSVVFGTTFPKSPKTSVPAGWPPIEISKNTFDVTSSFDTSRPPPPPKSKKRRATRPPRSRPRSALRLRRPANPEAHASNAIAETEPRSQNDAAESRDVGARPTTPRPSSNELFPRGVLAGDSAKAGHTETKHPMPPHKPMRRAHAPARAIVAPRMIELAAK